MPEPSLTIEHLLTDSRRLVFPATTLFFAMRSEQRDGHVFIAELYQRGVRNFVVELLFDQITFADANFIVVTDSLAALQQLAAHHRSLFNYPVIGITGSNGKTIVKEWLYELLSEKYNIVRSPRSYNSQVGVPLSVWQMDDINNMAIFEAGISMPGEMDKLRAIIKPTIGIFTNIGEAHAENFPGPEDKALEKIKLFSNVEKVFYCADDLNAAKVIGELRKQIQKRFWSRSNAGADLYAYRVERKDGMTSIRARYRGKEVHIVIPFIDEASTSNAITCWLVCLEQGIQQDRIKAQAKHLQAVDMRLQLLQGVNNCSVVNDSYSMDTASLAVALDFLLQQEHQQRRTVIISDIPAAIDATSYREVVDMLQAKNIHRVIAIGQKWIEWVDLLRGKIQVVETYPSTAVFLQHFSSNHFRNEAILLKGARAFEFEKISALLGRKVHQTIMEINLSALLHNLKEYRQLLKTGVKLMAMVKAFGYGSGSVEIAKLLQFYKVDYLAVAYADEGVELRKAGISLPVMVMNVDEEAFETLVQYQLEPELFSINIFNAFTTFLSRQGLQQYPVHIKLDTGMHRLGFDENDQVELLSLLKSKRQIKVQSVFSHLASGEDVSDDAFTMKQGAVFAGWCAAIKEGLGYNFIQHISNSAAILRHPSLQFDMVRLGIGLFGVDSSNEHKLSLRNVVTLKTTIAQLRLVKKRETVGYNRRGKVMRDSAIATLRIGYADGFRRVMSNGVGKVWVRGRVAPVIGTVAMDMLMVDVTGISDVAEGDEVEIFGSNIPVQDVAKACNTIAYEILTGISQRVKRVYIEE